MSWLSGVFGILLITILAIWAHPPTWHRMALDKAAEKNVSVKWKIMEAWKATIAVDTKLHEYYIDRLNNPEKQRAERIMGSAHDSVNDCVEKFYQGLTMERFQDCMHHVVSLHFTRLENVKKNTEPVDSGASRLKIGY
ncbi:hypothetical protein KR009_002232 [Drosophila setifemur]|nr:hypothetical protein KR009_002232 [Drosophila setifemur]